MNILAVVISFLFLGGCAHSLAMENSLATEVVKPPRLQPLASFSEEIRGVGSCGQDLLVVSGGWVWRVNQGGKKTQILKPAGTNVTFAACVDGRLVLLEDYPRQNRVFKRMMVSDFESDTLRTMALALLGDTDLHVVSLKEAYLSDYQFGFWYVARSVAGDPRGKTSLLARGRFPVPCGDDCFVFIADESDGFSVRKYQSGQVSLVTELGSRPPTAFTIFNGQFVVAYPDEVVIGRPGLSIPLDHVWRLLVWNSGVVAVTRNRLFLLDAPDFGSTARLANPLGI